MFNVRKIAKHLKMYRKVSRVALEVPDHPEIREFHERIRLASGCCLSRLYTIDSLGAGVASDCVCLSHG